jgi:hypothetical protein
MEYSIAPAVPRPALQGTLAQLPGKAPDVTALRDPEQSFPPSHPSFPCALSLHPSPPRGFQTGEK